ncbi:MAG: hypothetical protein U1D30_04520 [Planctomycetota bacterium]
MSKIISLTATLLVVVGVHPATSVDAADKGIPSKLESDLRQVQIFFDRMSSALDRRAGEDLANLYDVDRLGDRIHDAGGIPRLEGGVRREFGGALKLAIEGTLHRKDQEEETAAFFRKPKVLRLLETGIPDERIAIVEHSDAARHRSLARWWLSRENGEWRAFDREDSAVGLCMSTQLAMNLLPDLYPREQVLQSLRVLERATDEAVGHVELRDCLFDLVHVRLPKAFDAHRRVLLALLALKEGRYRNAMQHLDVADELKGGAPAVLALKTTALQKLGRFRRSLGVISKYRELLGDDATARCLEARALAGLGNTEASLNLLQRSLKSDSNEEEYWFAFGMTLPRARKDELTKLLLQKPLPRDLFHAVGEELYEEGDAEALEALAQAYARQYGDDFEPAWYRARACLLREEYAKGAKWLDEVSPRVTKDDSTAEFQFDYFVSRLKAKRWQDVYAEADDPSRLFRQIADGLTEEEDPAPLEELLKFHRERHPNDPWLDYYTALMLSGEGKFDQADEEFKAGAARVTSDEDKETFRIARVEARYAAGQAVSAYSRIPPQERTFAQLADYCFEDKQPDLLETLIDAHRVIHPRDPRLFLAEADLYWLQGNMARVAKCLEDHERALVDAESDEVFQRYLDLRVRALIRTGQGKEALRVAKTDPETDRDPWLATIAHAAIGNVAETEACIARSLEWSDGSFFDYLVDEDLGTSLDAVVFADLRFRWMQREYDQEADEIVVIAYAAPPSLEADSLLKSLQRTLEIADASRPDAGVLKIRGRNDLFEIQTNDYLFLVRGNVLDWGETAEDFRGMNDPTARAIKEAKGCVTAKIFSLRESADKGEIRRHAGRLAKELAGDRGIVAYFPHHARVAALDAEFLTRLAGPRPLAQLGMFGRLPLPEPPLPP